MDIVMHLDWIERKRNRTHTDRHIQQTKMKTHSKFYDDCECYFVIPINDIIRVVFFLFLLCLSLCSMRFFVAIAVVVVDFSMIMMMIVRCKHQRKVPIFYLLSLALFLAHSFIQASQFVFTFIHSLSQTRSQIENCKKALTLSVHLFRFTFKGSVKGCCRFVQNCKFELFSEWVWCVCVQEE